MTARIIAGEHKYYVVGCYCPPKDLVAWEYAQKAYKQCPQGFVPIVMGDINVDVDRPETQRDQNILAGIDSMLLEPSEEHFFRRRGKGMFGTWTYRQKKEGRWCSKRLDYFLIRKEDRKKIKTTRICWPRHHRSDHRLVEMTVATGSVKATKAYRRQLQKFPLQREGGGDTELERIYNTLKEQCGPIPKRERAAYKWISERSWKIWDRKNSIPPGRKFQRRRRRAKRKFDSSLKQDRIDRAKHAAEKINAHFKSNEIHEAFDVAEGWYKTAKDVPSKPCYETLERQTVEREELYARREVPGPSIPCNVEPYDVQDTVPEDPEIRSVVSECLHNGKATGHSKMRPEDIKKWLRDKIAEEEGRKEGGGFCWDLLVKLIQGIWETGSIPEELEWIIIVLIPKDDKGNYRGIGLMEPIWKIMEGIMNRRLQAIQLHDSLHGSVKRRGTGTATIEAKLVQQLSYIEQEPLYAVFIDLRKAFDAMDRDRCLQILKDYGVGPNILRLIKNFWHKAVLVCRASGRYGRAFKQSRGVTQGGPLSPRLFNIVVDAVVREWLRRALGEEAAKNGVAAMAAKFIVLFYVDDGYIASRDPELLQKCVDTLVEIFERVGLYTNVDKTKAMTCLPGKIRYRLSDESYNRRFGSGEQAEEQVEEEEEDKVECHICKKMLKPASLQKHLEKQHSVYRSKIIDREFVEERESVEYTCETVGDKLCCPVEGCDYNCKTYHSMRRHFCYRHDPDMVRIPNETPSLCPKCDKCCMQVNCKDERAWGRHWRTKTCKKGNDRRLQREAWRKSARAADVKFYAYGKELERVDIFKYLGKLTSYDDSDIQAIRNNLKKARRTWARLSHVCRSENIPPKIAAVFYQAVIQSVLLFGSETWCLNEQQY